MKVLVLDIGGTFIKWARMDEDMNIDVRGKVPTPQEGREALIETIGSLYDEDTSIDGIAISMPGIIDAEDGYVAMGGALHYNDDFYLRHELFKRCPVNIHIENDAKCAAMAEAGAGALMDTPDGFVLIFGTMIGGAFIKDHRLYRGRHFSAGEVSYIITGRGGYPDADVVFGNRCGVPNLCRTYASRKGLPESEVDGIRFFADVNADDEVAVECLNQYAHEIAVQIFNIQTALDPGRFAIGGGISAQPVLIDAIRKQLKKLYSICPYVVPEAEVVACKFQNDANLYGALQCYLVDFVR